MPRRRARAARRKSARRRRTVTGAHDETAGEAFPLGCKEDSGGVMSIFVLWRRTLTRSATSGHGRGARSGSCDPPWWPCANGTRDAACVPGSKVERCVSSRPTPSCRSGAQSMPPALFEARAIGRWRWLVKRCQSRSERISKRAARGRCAVSIMRLRSRNPDGSGVCHGSDVKYRARRRVLVT